MFTSNVLANISPQDFIYSDALNITCKEGSPLQEDIMYCVSKEYLLSDKALNEIYQEKVKNLGFLNRFKLKLEQRNWSNMKKENCNDVYSDMGGGREAPIEFLSCYSEENRNRIKFLEGK